MRQKMRYWGHLLLLVLWVGVEICNARPQTRDGPNTDADSPTSTSGGSRLTNEDRAFFAPGSWQPIPSQFSGLIIDEAPSRVRVEKYDSSLRDARSKDELVETPPVVIPPTNATDNTTTRGKSPTPLGDAIKMVASQLLQSRGAVAESDVRAPPPKAKTTTHKVQEETSHQGVAIPVVIEDTEHILASTTRKTTTTTPTLSKKTYTTSPGAYEKKTQSTPSQKKQQATTKKPTAASLRHPVTSIPDGLTTWVFLSGSSAASLVATTPSPTLSTRLVTKSTTVAAKKTQRIGTTTTTVATPSEKTHNVVKKPSPLFTSSGTKPNRMTKKPVVAVEESETVSANSKNKNKEMEIKATASRLEEGVAFRRRPVSSEVEATPTTTTFKPFPTAYPLSTASAVTDEGSAETSAETSVEASAETSAETSSEEEANTEVVTEDTTTKQTKKKKKNKNKRRRRPVVKPQEEEEDEDELESKTESDDEEGLTKTPVKGKPSRPLTTRIYNYLAREIMPSVGVGLIGLVGLAGLAGLIMYPFGGGALPIRRNYNVAPKPNYYYYEHDEGGQSEEEVLGKVLAGMKDPSYVTGEQAYQPEPESRTPIQGEAYTRYDVGSRISNHQESQPIRNDYDASGRISSKNRVTAHQEEQPQVQYESDSRVSGSVRVGSGHQDATHYEGDVIASRVTGVTNQEAVIPGSQHPEDTHYGVEEAVTVVRAPVQNRGSQRLGENDAVAAPQASALYATRNEPRPVFNNDWSMVKTDAQEAVSSNNNNHHHSHHELKYATGNGDVDAIYGQSAQREERLRYDTVQSPQYSGVSRVGVGQKRIATVEHGPRRLRRDVIKKDSAKEDLEENEIINLEVSDEPVYTFQRVHVQENEGEQKVTKVPPKKDLGMTLKKTKMPVKLEAIEVESTKDEMAVTEVSADSSESYTESSDKSNEATDKSNEATDNTNEATDNTNEATDIRNEATDIRNEATDNRNETTDKSIELTDVSNESTDKKIYSFESTSTKNVNTNDVDVDDTGKDGATSLPPDATTTVTEENITLETESPEDPSLIGLIRRVAQYKIRLGLSFLRNTSQAFSRYLEGMQRRVEDIVKENAKNRNRLQKRKSAHEDYY